MKPWSQDPERVGWRKKEPASRSGFEETTGMRGEGFFDRKQKN